MNLPSMYPTKKILGQTLIAFLLLFGHALKAQNGTIHALLLIDEYSDIAAACIADKFKMEEEVQVIAQKTRMELNLQNIDYSKAGLEKTIAELEVSENDVIFFYFTGHGYRYDGQEKCGDYPYLYITKEKQDLYDAGICLEWIDRTLKAKGARLVVTLADCCNNILPYQEPVAMNSGILGEVYKQLFLLSEGYILATSSLPGQYSFATNNGGYFTNSFLEAIREYTSFEEDYENIHWDNILRKTTAKTIISSESKQRPQYKTHIKAITEEEIPGMVTIPTKN